jgi:hypothetical protein
MPQTYINQITEPGEVHLQKETSGSLYTMVGVNNKILRLVIVEDTGRSWKLLHKDSLHNNYAKLFH